MIFYYWWIANLLDDTFESGIYLLKRYIKRFLFLKKQSSQLVQNCMIETRHFTGVFSSVLTIIFELLVILSVILLLLSIQFKITLITLAIILAIMLLYHKLVSKTFGRWGSIREEFGHKVTKITK